MLILYTALSAVQESLNIQLRKSLVGDRRVTLILDNLTNVFSVNKELVTSLAFTGKVR